MRSPKDEPLTRKGVLPQRARFADTDKLAALLSALLFCGSTGWTQSTPPVSFRNEVMAVLSKAGCTAGTCHGNKNGKGGFKLSLRGQDPALDHLALSRDASARRTNPLDPEQSLILLKPTTQLAHEGGLRFAKDSP